MPLLPHVFSKISISWFNWRLHPTSLETTRWNNPFLSAFSKLSNFIFPASTAAAQEATWKMDGWKLLPFLLGRPIFEQTAKLLPFREGRKFPRFCLSYLSLITDWLLESGVFSLIEPWLLNPGWFWNPGLFYLSYLSYLSYTYHVCVRSPLTHAYWIADNG